jgi:hypothetical protein
MKIENLCLFNLFESGLVTNGGDELAKFTTINNQYRFELKRENYQLWCTNTSYKYKCIIDIYDNITNNHLVNLNLTEEDVMNVLDCYTQMNDFGTSSICVPPLKPYNSNGNYYIIELEGYRVNKLLNIMEDICNRWFNIKEYNPLINQLVPILSIQLDISEIEELMDLFYFIFLIDSESSNNQLALTDYPAEYTRYGV